MTPTRDELAAMIIARHARISAADDEEFTDSVADVVLPLLRERDERIAELEALEQRGRKQRDEARARIAELEAKVERLTKRDKAFQKGWTDE